MSKIKNAFDALKKKLALKKELFASEVLEKTLKELAKKHPNRRVIFLEEVSTTIAVDSDAHRIRRGYMKYKEVRIFQFNGRYWALGLGKACGSYPARPYQSDIIAIEVLPDESVSAEKIAEKIQIEGFGFSSSLIIARADGTLTVERNTIFPIEQGSVFYKMREYLNKIIPEFTAEEIKTSGRCISASDLRPVVTQSQRYKPELVAKLVESIPKILGK